jgi:hypothetical protein
MAALRGLTEKGNEKMRQWIQRLILLSGLIAHAAFAQTMVAGDISVDTTWTIARSPYEVTGPVRVMAGALLTIEPGVVVRFHSGEALLQIEQGALRAVGTPTQRIVLTSVNEVPGQTPAPGDWSGVQFMPNTDDARTRLRYVDVRYGRGIQIQQASPRLDDLSLQANLGAAITLDLVSSPLGRGLVASGNTLNGIAVPEGRIAGSTRWGLVGIPYVLASGALEIGVPATPSLSLRWSSSAVFIASGTNQTVSLELSEPAPAAGLIVNLTSTRTDLLTLPAQVTIPAGARSVLVSIQGTTLGDSAYPQITATAPGYIQADLPVFFEREPIRLFAQTNPNLELLSQGMRYSVQISGSELGMGGLPGHLPIDVRSSDERVARFRSARRLGVGAIELDALSPGSTTLTISSVLGIEPLTILVIVREPPRLRANYTEFALGRGMQTQSLTIERVDRDGNPLLDPFPITVHLDGLDTAFVAAGPAIIPAGQSSVNISMRGIARTTTPMSLTPQSEGYTAQGALAVRVIQPDLMFYGLEEERTLSTSRDNFGVAWSTVGLSGYQVPEHTSTFQISVADQNPESIITGIYSSASGVELADRIMIQNGVYSGDRDLYVGAPQALGSYRLRAELPGVGIWHSGLQRVMLPRLVPVRSSLVLGKGLYTQIYFDFRVGNVATSISTPSAVTMSLRVSDLSKVRVPDTVTISAGGYGGSSRIRLEGLELSSEPIRIEASAPGYESGVMNVQVVQPQFSVAAVGGDVVGQGRQWARATVEVPGADRDFAQYSMADVPVDLHIVDTEPAAIVDGLYPSRTGGTAQTRFVLRAESQEVSVPAGGSLWVGEANQTGRYRIRATAPGFTESYSQPVEIGKELALWTDASDRTADYRIGQGMRSSGYGLLLRRFDEAGPITVTLQVSDPRQLSLPSSVVLEGCCLQIPVVGLEPTTDPVVITASAPGYVRASRLAHVLPARLMVEPMSISIGQTVPLTTWFIYSRAGLEGGVGQAAQRTSVNLSIVEASPAGVVDGLYQDAEASVPFGGTAFIAEGGSALEAPVYVGPARRAGSFRIRTHIAGLGEWISQPIMVTPASRKQSAVSVPTKSKQSRTAQTQVIGGAP